MRITVDLPDNLLVRLRSGRKLDLSKSDFDDLIA
jgi:hypothetical protein